jgi:hypothetical protein
MFQRYPVQDYFLLGYDAGVDWYEWVVTDNISEEPAATILRIESSAMKWKQQIYLKFRSNNRHRGNLEALVLLKIFVCEIT